MKLDGQETAETRNYGNVVVATVPLAALGTPPIEVPDPFAVRHRLVPRSITKRLGGALFRDVVLLVGVRSPVGVACGVNK